MINTVYNRGNQSNPSFAGLMALYERNYRLMTALIKCIDDRCGVIQNKDGYTLKVVKKSCSSYTENLELYYSFHTQRRGRKIIIAIADFKVRVYLDTCQAAVSYSEIKLKKYLPTHGFLFLCQEKWYYNQCLAGVLRSFFHF